MLIVLRHGRTATNAGGRLLGRADPPLDELGAAQAVAAGAALGPVDRVVSSPLLRCRQTAASVASPAGIEVDERWIELDYGEWDGLPLADVPADSWVQWRRDLGFAPPGGESLLALSARVRDALAELVDDARHRTVVVVTHVSPVKATLAWALGASDSIAWRAYVAPASVMRVAVGDGGPSLHAFNDVAHLASIG